MKLSILRGSKLMVAAALALCMGTTASAPPSGGGASPPKTLIAIMLGYSDTGTYLTQQQCEGMLFTDPASVSNYYKTITNGKIWFTGNVYSVILNKPWAERLDTDMQTLAYPIVAAQGVDINSYDRIGQLDDDFTTQHGQTSLGAKTFWCSVPTFKLVAHELGHTFNMNHSFAVPTVSSNSWDWSCVMGASSYRNEFNANQREKWGWLASKEVVSVTGTSTVTLRTLNQDPAFDGATGPRVAKLTKNGSLYTVSYRTEAGTFDGYNTSVLPGEGIYINTLFHYAAEYAYRVNIHSRPSNGPSTSFTTCVDTLLEGEVFENADIRVTWLFTNAGRPVVQVVKK